MNKKPRYNQEREARWLKAMLEAHYTTGECVSFHQPEPESYSKTYLALRLVGSAEYADSWTGIKTDNLHEAQAYVQESKRWYIHNIDNGTFTSEEYKEWVDQNQPNVNRMRHWREKLGG